VRLSPIVTKTTTKCLLPLDCDSLYQREQPQLSVGPLTERVPYFSTPQGESLEFFFPITCSPLLQDTNRQFFPALIDSLLRGPLYSPLTVQIPFSLLFPLKKGFLDTVFWLPSTPKMLLFFHFDLPQIKPSPFARPLSFLSPSLCYFFSPKRSGEHCGETSILLFFSSSMNSWCSLFSLENRHCATGLWTVRPFLPFLIPSKMIRI